MASSRVFVRIAICIGSLACFGCTTKFSAATDAHAGGDFEGASLVADKLVPTDERDGKVSALKVSYERDEMWIGLEKAMILLDAGRIDEAIRLFSHVDGKAAFLRTIESAYLNNPVDPANWDASQFAEDAGQVLLGADQTTYLLQPHEMILARSYLALGKLLAGVPGAESDAREAQRYQDLMTGDMRIAGEKFAQPPVQRMDGVIRGSISSGQTAFSVAGIFTLGEFDQSKHRMEQAIESAKAVRAADPRVAFAAAVAWASYMRSGQKSEALNAARALGDLSGAVDACKAMTDACRDGTPDFVLVLVDAGRAPVRRSFDVRVPIVIPNVGSTGFRAVYPDLQFRTEGRPSVVSVADGGSETQAFPMDSIDAIAARDFRRREPELWWAPTIRAAIRAIATVVAQAAQEEDSTTTKLLIALGGVAVAEAEQPDLRMWSTLPATQHVALVRRPSDGVVRLGFKGENGISGSAEISVPEGRSIVFVRAFTPQIITAKAAPLAVTKSPETPSPDGVGD